ncbi:MAG: ornithine carbamoyltransferase [Cardiobacteriaceae bacterium]|nr:ornithine carbamoyltransferase [Cardiobacteriaceae bacterium]
MNYWHQKSLLKLADHPREAVIALLDLAATLKSAKRNGTEVAQLRGKNIALLFEKTSTRTRCAFEVACYDQGAQCSYIAPDSSQMGEKESIADTARVLSRLYDAIEYRGFAQKTVENLAKYAGIPVYNGLTEDYHPTQMLADLLTMREHSDKPLGHTTYTYLGDARYNTGNSLLLAGALIGMDVRIVAPKTLQPAAEIIAHAQQLAANSGARITITDDIVAGVNASDFIHTDIWVSMGEGVSEWEKRTKLLLPYRVTTELMAASGNPHTKFMHCLPAYHDRNTPTGETFYQQHGLEGIEVSNDVFEGAASLVFEQAENRLHTIKALLVATLT